jgi:hypothetical protein
MIIEFELLGSKTLHKGVFDSTGFWVKYEVDRDENLSDSESDYINGYKIFSHFSFAFYHTDQAIVDLVYSKLVSVLRGSMSADIEGVGYIRKLNK